MKVLVPPEYGRPSPAAASEPVLAPAGGADRAGWRAEGASTGWCTLRAASVVGVRHRLAGAASDDFFAWGHLGGEERIVAVSVADGVGSLAGAAGAAARACSASVEAALLLAGAPPSERADAGLAAANRAAAGGGATTLVLAVIEAGGSAGLVRVGDSTALALAPDGSAVEVFEAPEEPAMALAETAALPDPTPGAERIEVSLGSREALVLLTDGVAGPWRDGPSTVAPTLGVAIAGVPSPLELLHLADFSRQGCHDDRTILCVWPEGKWQSD